MKDSAAPAHALCGDYHKNLAERGALGTLMQPRAAHMRTARARRRRRIQCTCTCACACAACIYVYSCLYYINTIMLYII